MQSGENGKGFTRVALKISEKGSTYVVACGGKNTSGCAGSSTIIADLHQAKECGDNDNLQLTRSSTGAVEPMHETLNSEKQNPRHA